MKKTIGALAVLALVGAFGGGGSALGQQCDGFPDLSGDYEMVLQSGGIVRTYLLSVPEVYDGSSPLPLVVNFHGLDSWPEEQEARSGFAEKGREEGFMVATPLGYGNSWNGGVCCNPAVADRIDDVQFARDLVADVQRQFCLDGDRVFATGFSNGGLMSYRLACEASDLFAAAAPASALLGVRDCAPERRVPIISDHGTVDFNVPYALGYKSIEWWAATDGCSEETTVFYDEGGASCRAFNDCMDGTEVHWCEIKGMQHEWPTWETGEGWFDATDFFWDFFSRHPMP